MTHWTDTLFREQADLFAESFEDMFEAADEQVGDLLELLAESYDCEPARSLDVACGVGRHVLPLADRGVEAEGLDFSAEFVDRAREHASERDRTGEATFHEADMRTLEEWSGTYDLITILWNSIGYYGKETDVQVLADARELLSEDGVLVLDLSNRDFLLGNFDDATVSEDEERLSIYRQEYDPETGQFATTFDVFDVTDEGYDYVDRMEWENRLYAPPVLRELCLEAGYETVSLYGGFDGSDLTRESRRVVAVAR